MVLLRRHLQVGLQSASRSALEAAGGAFASPSRRNHSFPCRSLRQLQGKGIKASKRRSFLLHVLGIGEWQAFHHPRSAVSAPKCVRFGAHSRARRGALCDMLKSPWMNLSRAYEPGLAAVDQMTISGQPREITAQMARPPRLQHEFPGGAPFERMRVARRSPGRSGSMPVDNEDCSRQARLHPGGHSCMGRLASAVGSCHAPASDMPSYGSECYGCATCK